ncbi:MAG: pectate lyase [Candidatus Hydrogenedentes bacterium]|nr:pectate lyase [Candidatus Hydrogenedentota bacterium]
MTRNHAASIVAAIVVFYTGPCFAASAQPEDSIVAAAKTKEWKAIDIRPFQSAIHHAVMKFRGQKAPYEQYPPEKIIHIGENILAYQNSGGGWPKNIDWTRVFSPEELTPLPHGGAGKPAGDSTFDNDNTWTQIGYLAQVYEQSHLQRYADSALKGIDYILAEQRPSGGWRGSDVDAITFNDGVMAGVLRTIKAAGGDTQLYSFVDDTRRARAKAAYEKGIRCTLDCQIKVNGRLTAWCEQHDHGDLKPIWARTFEPPSITPDESVDVVRVLMTIDNPLPEVVRAVQAAVAWFDKVKIPGIRIEKVPAEPVEFQFHYSDYELVEVKDPNAPPIWARYYDLDTEKPIFCNRERKITSTFAELNRERRTGTAWYGYWPAKLLTKEYPRWQKRWAPNDNVLTKPGANLAR